MTQETKIIGAILASKDCFRTAEKWIDPERELSPAGAIIWKLVGEFYDLDPKAETTDREILRERLRSRVKSKHVALYEGLIVNTSGEAVAPANAIDLVREYKQTVAGQELQRALSGSDKGVVKDCIDRYLALENADDSRDDRIYTGYEALVSIVGRQEISNRIQLAPDQLNVVTGGVVRGQHVIVFARPESGKSLWAINQTGCWLRSGLRVLYIGNEDPASLLLQRLVSNITGVRTGEVQERLADLRDSLLEVGFYERFMFAEFAPGTRYREVHSLIEDFRPDCVIIDQMYNMGAMGTTKTETLAGASMAGRAIAKKYQVVVLQVTQAGDSATNKLVLEMNDIEYSNTGVAAQADLMIGLGTNDDFERRGQLMVALCKNKLSDQGHPFFPVNVDRSLSRVS